jgi:hypothetical protein
MRADSNLSNSSKKSSPLTLREPDQGLVDALMEIGQERQKILVAMKAALLRGDDDEALERARQLTGIPTKRPNSRS